MRQLWNASAFVVMVAAAMVSGFMATDQMSMGLASGLGNSLPQLGNGLTMAATGVFFGLLLAWGSRIHWRTIPTRFRYWLVLQRRRFWWTTAAAASIGVLIFY